jgi:hypothetical protein
MPLRRVAALAVLAVLAPAGSASAQLQSGSGLTAPAYPGNTIRIERTDPFVASTTQRVRLAGHAQWDPETFKTIPDYDLFLYVQDAAVDGTCAPWYGMQSQKAINLPGLSASASISGWVVEGDQSLSPPPGMTATDWAGDSLPFSVKLGVRRVLLCAYQRFIIDDVASYALSVPVEPPGCTLATRSIRRGSKLRVECNVSGALRARFKGRGRVRTLSGKLSTKNGKGTIRTRLLRPGRYRVSFSSNGTPLKGGTTVRIRP